MRGSTLFSCSCGWSGYFPDYVDEGKKIHDRNIIRPVPVCPECGEKLK